MCKLLNHPFITQKGEINAVKHNDTIRLNKSEREEESSFINYNSNSFQINK